MLAGESPQPLVARRAAILVEEALADTRVVAISGPRQSGKSTLARLVAATRPRTLLRTLDDPEMRELALADPRTFLQHDGLMVIDEVQRAPDLLLSIKAEVDRDPRPGQFLLTGSSDLRTSSRMQDTLPGRMEIIDLWPFSQGELSGGDDGLLDALLDRQLTAQPGAKEFSRSKYLELAVRGGFPEAIRRSGRRRTAFHRAWLRAVIERDAASVVNIERPDDLARLADLMAAHTTSHVAIDRIARELELPASTTRRYLAVLEQTFVLTTLPSWHSSDTSRAVKMRKALFADSGLAASIAGVTASALEVPVAPMAGPLIETFALLELVKQASWSPLAPRLHHFRTRDGVEVDLVAEAPDGRVCAFEVKSAATVRDRDFRGLRYLRQRLGERFVGGVVLHCGPTLVQWGTDLWALPLSALWSTSRPT